VGRVDFIDVSKHYGETGAVHNVDLTVEDSEFLVLLGPSGCGKSTILKMVAGLEDVTSGEIYIDGRLVNYVKPGDRNVAMVFQNYALYPHMTVQENIAFPLNMAKVPKAEIRERVARTAGILGLENLLDRRPEQLSGGQRQRVALARSIVREPAVFLMDEPLSNLDAQLRVQTREELLKLHERLQTTTIYVTHDQIEAMTMGHRIVVLRAGVMQQVGQPQDVYDHPVNTFVAAFLGSPRINLHAGEVESDGDNLYFRQSDTRIRLPERLAVLCRNRALAGEIAIGVRPEDIGVSTNGAVDVSHTGSIAALDAFISLIEPIGSDLFINATSGGLSWTARTEARLPVALGQQVTLLLNLDHAHVFGSDGVNLVAA
jgi:multiple sugar transport system ATP-binding protein